MVMLRLLFDLFLAVRVFFLQRTNLALEILALRQQVAVLKRKRAPLLRGWFARLPHPVRLVRALSSHSAPAK
jgi:hypothetical protein